MDMLETLDAARNPNAMNIPGWDFHQLSGKMKGRYSVHVNGNWCITFGWEEPNAIAVSYEDYH